MSQYQSTPQFEISLRQIDPTRARSRAYHLRVCRSLFGEPALLITWGRIGAHARVRLETFGTEDALDVRRRELLARRAAHGYAATEIATA